MAGHVQINKRKDNKPKGPSHLRQILVVHIEDLLGKVGVISSYIGYDSCADLWRNAGGTPIANGL